MNKSARVRVSIGVAHFHSADDVRIALAEADEALYKAKQTGRNRVYVKAWYRISYITSNWSDECLCPRCVVAISTTMLGLLSKMFTGKVKSE
ncbi:GGDEF domain-containing protein [Vibrio campbellii]|uniref:GGDEF domain-containing protein n=1 Tax=Vibrio campbellii TaxID=680 RepID=UPI002108F326|nr:diguanylate cyclase [Vibrio campbellii]